jgi:hypothetical protein
MRCRREVPARVNHAPTNPRQRTTRFVNLHAQPFQAPSPPPRSGFVQQDHWSERGRATSVANADALGRPRRSVLSFGGSARARHVNNSDLTNAMKAKDCNRMRGRSHDRAGQTSEQGRRARRRTLLRFAVALTVLIAAVALFKAASFLHRKPPTLATNTSAKTSATPRTLDELLALPPSELNDIDIALMNLLCADGLPGAENLNVEQYLATLDQWAQHANREIARNYHHFRKAPAFYYHSEAFYKMLMLAVVVYEDFGIRYNPKWIAPPSEMRADDHFFADSRDILIHGMTGPQRMGTCSSMPVLYIALGRRLGYPLKLVTTKQHLFMRWDSPTERFNMDATGKGLDKYDDEHYKRWPFPISEQDIKEQDYLKSLSSREELSVFL